MKTVFGMKKVAVVLFIVLMLFGVCVPDVFSEDAVEISVTPGANWKTTMWIFVIPIAKTPQFAAWIETADGRFVKTILVTGKAAKENWMSCPVSGRPEALPVWSHAAGKLVVDAESSATPRGDESVTGILSGLLSGSEYIVRFEINKSFDYNDSWLKNAKPGEKGFSGVNGQPSLVYEAHFIAGRAATIHLVPAGRGSVDGSDGIMIPGLAGLTTALSIVNDITVTVKGE